MATKAITAPVPEEGKIWTREFFQAELYNKLEGLEVQCSLIRPFYGGQPATKETALAFCIHHLGLEGREATEAAARIMKEEIRSQRVQDTGALTEGSSKELEDVHTYGINALRRSAHGAYIGDWQIKACVKQAMSRLGLFQAKAGVRKAGGKGEVAEGGFVKASGPSRPSADPVDAYQIHFFKPGSTPGKVERFNQYLFERRQGCVSTPQGRHSIQYDVEYVPPGWQFNFELYWLQGQIKVEDALRALALCQNSGLGSIRSMEQGKFEIHSAKEI